MNMPDGGPPVADDYKCRFSLQDGWVDLSLEGGTKAEALGLAGQAVDRFNPIELTVGGRELVDELADRAMYLNKGEPNFAASYYTAGGIRLADLLVDSYGEESTPRPAPAEVTPLLLDWSNAEIVGDPDIAYMDLATGAAAVRVRSVLKVKRMLGFGSRLGEFIKYAVFPPGFNTLDVIAVSWENMERSDEIAQLADELVSTMTIVHVDADGNEIPHELPS
ncbi:hypothetical protein ACFVXC_32445 [Streptomyces sp. NPDC058257]|uniref:hypothetical protein n=1 Tax=Streptomyces sp. NPDC058257 TaxID=3346409 RepID=UPI0036ED13CB